MAIPSRQMYGRLDSNSSLEQSTTQVRRRDSYDNEPDPREEAKQITREDSFQNLISRPLGGKYDQQ